MAESPPSLLVGRHPRRSSRHSLASAALLLEDQILSQQAFMRMLMLERKRSERSNDAFVLMLIRSAKLFQFREDNHPLRRLLLALSTSTRETDIKGWYTEDDTIGVVFTEVGTGDGHRAAKALQSRVTDVLSQVFSDDEFKSVSVSFYLFPEDAEAQDQRGHLGFVFYPDLSPERDGKASARSVKRTIDIVGSALALILSFPFMLAISLAIKASSKGPVLYKQARVGLHGRTFTFLKFRTMYWGNDHKIHEEYTKRMISGTGHAGGEAVYKMQNDPRITTVGRFLRKTSLDELPQFFSVLKGEMSLVGPRPPIPYEVEAYATWHKRRLLAAKPGITGLWQVSGRSRLRFDEMVRLDLKYAQSWSLSQDLKILLKTPAAVLSGHGAY